MTEFFQAVSNFGFPVVVAGYLLFRFEGRIDKLDKSINALEKSVQELITEVKLIKRR